MCALSREEFCGRAPSFVGDILWEHLVLLQQDVDRDAAALKNAPSNLSETSTEPVSMPRLPPSPPGAQQPLYHQSPQKTYHTLSPQRHAPYSAPTPPLSYTSLDHRQATPPLTAPVKTEFKTEYPAPVSSHYPQYNQYQAYQRLPYQPYYYDPLQPPVSSHQYPVFPAGPGPAQLSSLVPVDPGSQVTAGRWPVPVSTGAAGTYQVRIISHYFDPLPPPANTILRKLSLSRSQPS